VIRVARIRPRNRTISRLEEFNAISGSEDASIEFNRTDDGNAEDFRLALTKL